MTDTHSSPHTSRWFADSGKLLDSSSQPPGTSVYYFNDCRMGVKVEVEGQETRVTYTLHDPATRGYFPSLEVETTYPHKTAAVLPSGTLTPAIGADERMAQAEVSAPGAASPSKDEEVEADTLAGLFKDHGRPFLKWCLEQGVKSASSANSKPTERMTPQDQAQRVNVWSAMLETLPQADPRELILGSLKKARAEGMPTISSSSSRNEEERCLLRQGTEEFETVWETGKKGTYLPCSWQQTITQVPDSRVRADDPRLPGGDRSPKSNHFTYSAHRLKESDVRQPGDLNCVSSVLGHKDASPGEYSQLLPAESIPDASTEDATTGFKNSTVRVRCRGESKAVGTTISGATLAPGWEQVMYRPGEAHEIQVTVHAEDPEASQVTDGASSAVGRQDHVTKLRLKGVGDSFPGAKNGGWWNPDVGGASV